MILEITVNGMKCQHCVKSIQEELKTIDGLLNCNINIDKKLVTVEMEDNKANEELIKSKINNLGFEAI